MYILNFSSFAHFFSAEKKKKKQIIIIKNLSKLKREVRWASTTKSSLLSHGFKETWLLNKLGFQWARGERRGRGCTYLITFPVQKVYRWVLSFFFSRRGGTNYPPGFMGFSLHRFVYSRMPGQILTDKLLKIIHYFKPRELILSLVYQ